MKSALIISAAVHLLISFIALNWVSFREVKYVPRQVYNVTLVTPQAQAQPVEPKERPQRESEVAPPEPEEEMVAPPPQPKPKPKKRKERKKKVVPTTELEKTKPPQPETEADETTPESVPETGDMAVDADDFPFAPYIQRMRLKIAAQWRVPQGSQGEDRHCRVYFRVHRDGSVSDVDVEESSGLFMFDQAAKRAVVQASPMPQLPSEFRDSYLGVHFSFAYREKR